MIRTELEKSQQQRSGNDAALLARARQGDKAALSEFYNATYQEVWRTIRALVKNEDDAADILQDTYLRAFNNLHQVQKPESLRPWLRQIAANTAKNYLVRKRPALFSELSSTDDSLPPDFEDDRTEALPEAHLDKKENQRLIREMLDTLSDEQRLVIGMYYYQELPVKQIAEQLELPLGTVKSQLRYGRQKIEKRVRELEKQGVKLYGLSPILLFRLAFKNSNFSAPSKISALGKQIAVRGTGALDLGAKAGMKVARVTASSSLLRGVGVAAVTVGLIGSAMFAGKLLNREKNLNDTPLPGPVSETPEDLLPTNQDENEDGGYLEDRGYLYDNWKDGFLGQLAGTAKQALTAEEYNQSQSTSIDGLLSLDTTNMLSQAYHCLLLSDMNSSEESARCWYLGDVKGNGNQDLAFWDFDGTAGLDLAFEFCEWSPEGVRSEAISKFYSPETACSDLRSTLLYSSEKGFVVYCECEIELPSTEPEYPMYYSNAYYENAVSLPWDYSPFDRFTGERLYEEGATVSYSGYSWCDNYKHFSKICCYTFENGNTLYYDSHWTSVSKEEYRQAEQDLLASINCVSIDQTNAPQLQNISHTEMNGPLTCEEVTEALGGFGTRTEWKAANAILQGETTEFAVQIISELTRDENRLFDYLHYDHPEAKEGGTWQFDAIMNHAPSSLKFDSYISLFNFIICYQERAEDGGARYVAYTDLFLPLEFYNNTARYIDIGQVFYRTEADTTLALLPQSDPDRLTPIVRCTVESSIGPRSILRELETRDPVLPPDTDLLTPVQLQSADALIEQLASGKLYRDPIPVKEYLGRSRDDPFYLQTIPFLEHPELWVTPLGADEAHASQLDISLCEIDMDRETACYVIRKDWDTENRSIYSIDQDATGLHAGGEDVISQTDTSTYKGDFMYYLAEGQAFEPVIVRERIDTDNGCEYTWFYCWATGDASCPYMDDELNTYTEEEFAQFQPLIFHSIPDFVEKLKQNQLTLDIAN